tara:strand:+ start:12251 stop:13375 length:1125 start_codon:yes stop_codon:yes gene_type:complete
MNKIKNIRLSKSNITSKEKKAVTKVMNKSFLGMGEEVKIFENNLSKFLSNNVVCVSSGTAALHLALLAIKIKEGDEVLVPSLTYIASFQAISATGATPVACDIYEDSLLINISDLKKKITKRTKAIMPVHYSGDPVNIQEIYKLAKKYNLRVIEDAAHAFGSKYNRDLIGSCGDIICFSFDGIKNITSGEGGCIVTKDKKIQNFVSTARLLGVSNDSTKRYNNKRTWDLKVEIQGWRYHMSNIMASIGIEQLKRFNYLKKKRQQNAEYYDALLKNNNKITLFKRNYKKIVPHIYVIKINSKKNLNNIREKLKHNNIETGLHYYPNHKLKKYFNPKLKLPITENIFKKIITLPLHPGINKRDIDYIVNKLNSYLQ